MSITAKIPYILATKDFLVYGISKFEDIILDIKLHFITTQKTKNGILIKELVVVPMIEARTINGSEYRVLLPSSSMREPSLRVYKENTSIAELIIEFQTYNIPFKIVSDNSKTLEDLEAILKKNFETVFPPKTEKTKKVNNTKPKITEQEVVDLGIVEEKKEKTKINHSNKKTGFKLKNSEGEELHESDLTEEPLPEEKLEHKTTPINNTTAYTASTTAYTPLNTAEYFDFLTDEEINNLKNEEINKQ